MPDQQIPTGTVMAWLSSSESRYTHLFWGLRMAWDPIQATNQTRQEAMSENGHPSLQLGLRSQEM